MARNFASEIEGQPRRIVADDDAIDDIQSSGRAATGGHNRFGAHTQTASRVASINDDLHATQGHAIGDPVGLAVHGMNAAIVHASASAQI